jgi:carboxypeptidase family protein
MKPKLLSLFLVALIPFMPMLAAAGEIRGTLTKGGQPVPDAKIDITAGSNRYPSTTDKYGSYRVFVPEKGQCTVTVSVPGIDGQHFSATVNSFDRSIQYDLMLEMEGGQYTLRTR